jgi:hypothetical protein
MSESGSRGRRRVGGRSSRRIWVVVSGREVGVEAGDERYVNRGTIKSYVSELRIISQDRRYSRKH